MPADPCGSGGAGGLTGVAVASRQSVRVTGAVVGNGCATLTSVECGMGQVLRRKCRDSWIGPASTARPGNEHTTLSLPYGIATSGAANPAHGAHRVEALPRPRPGHGPRADPPAQKTK